jgi:iron complex outermembrane recepter protein
MKAGSTRHLGAICLLVNSMATALAAQTSGSGSEDPTLLKKMSLEQLSQIEVTTVSKEPSGAFQTPDAVYVLTQNEIRRSGATNIPDLLRLVPGVEVAQIDSNKWAIGIRGFEGYLSKSVLVLIDGRSVYTPLFAGVYWNVQDTMIEDIDRIEVIRGPGGTIWGANAVNGVINIITKNAKDTRGTLVTAGGGNVEQGFLGARYGGGNDNLAYRVYGRGFTRGPFEHPDNRNFDDWRSGQAGFRLDWNPNRSDSVTVSGQAYQTYAGERLGLSYFSPPALINLDANGDFSGQNVVVGWRRKLASGSDIQVHAYFDRTDRRDLNYHEVRNTVDFDFIHHIALDRHDLIWGVGARISPSTFSQTVPSVDFTPHGDTYSIYSAFVQDSIALVSNRLIATVGTKLEHNSFSGFEVQPSGRIAWTPTEQQTVWAGVTRAVRTPSRIEEGFQFSFLASPSVPLYLRLVGDGQFDPEELDGYELGYRAYVTRGLLVSVNGFYNRYGNLLSVENRPPFPEATPSPLHYVLPLYLRNGIQAQTKGGEVSATWDARNWWRFIASYSYVHLNAERYAWSNDASTVRQLEGDSPQHKIVVQSLAALPRGWEFDLTFRYVSAIPDQLVTAYSTADVRLAKRIVWGLEFSVNGRNLFQPYHAEYGGDPGGLVGVSRSAFVKLTWMK